MKPIMSFWSKPYFENAHNKWVNEDSFRLSWTIAVAAVTKTAGKPTLYTDEKGKKLLVDEFGLEFAEVVECMSELDDYDPRFACLSRYAAISRQEEPFFHIDYDFYLWGELPDEIANKPVFFQSQSVFDNSRDDEFNAFQSPLHRPEEFMEEVSNVPSWWSKSIDNSVFRTYNCSMIGGSDFEVLHRIAESVLNLARATPRGSWDEFEDRVRSKYPEDAVLRSYGSIPSYTVTEFVPVAICAEENIIPAFLTNEYGMHSVQFTHISFAKQRNEEIHGMLLKRVIKDFGDNEEMLARLEIKQSQLPKVSIVIIPDEEETLYDCVLRSIVPRKQAPDETIVVDNGVRTSERKFLDRIDNIQIFEASPAATHMELMRAVSKVATGDIIVFIDSHVKVPRLYIEKSVAACLQYPNAAFCAATNDFQDQPRNRGFAYGATFDGASAAKPVVSEFAHDEKLIETVDCLYGGLYIMPREVMEKAFSLPHTAIEYLSTYLGENGVDLRCIKNLVVSQNFKRVTTA